MLRSSDEETTVDCALQVGNKEPLHHGLWLVCGEIIWGINRISGKPCNLATPQNTTNALQPYGHFEHDSRLGLITAESEPSGSRFPICHVLQTNPALFKRGKPQKGAQRKHLFAIPKPGARSDQTNPTASTSPTTQNHREPQGHKDTSHSKPKSATCEPKTKLGTARAA